MQVNDSDQVNPLGTSFSCCATPPGSKQHWQWSPGVFANGGSGRNVSLAERHGPHASFPSAVLGRQAASQSSSPDPHSLISSSPLLPDRCSTEKISKGLNVISERSVSFISFILSLNLLLPFIIALPLSASVFFFCSPDIQLHVSIP